MQIKKGLATWAGLVAAIGQYALSIALFMDTFDEADPTAGLGPLATATATLYAVIKGRMDQATAAIEATPKPGQLQAVTDSVDVPPFNPYLPKTWTPPDDEMDREPVDDGADIEHRDLHENGQT